MNVEKVTSGTISKTFENKNIVYKLAVYFRLKGETDDCIFFGYYDEKSKKITPVKVQRLTIDGVVEDNWLSIKENLKVVAEQIDKKTRIPILFSYQEIKARDIFFCKTCGIKSDVKDRIFKESECLACTKKIDPSIESILRRVDPSYTRNIFS